MAKSLRLDATELAVLSVLLGLRVTPLSTGKMKRASALESLVRRRIVDDKVERVSLPVATLLAVLARPRHQIAVTHHGSTSPHTVVAIQELTHVVHTTDQTIEILTPARDALSTVFPHETSNNGRSFSLPGRTWHDMVAQARFANEQQLARMAELDGADVNDAVVAARLAKRHGEREDARILSYRGQSRWRGTELSWIPDGEAHWLVDDGGRFGSAMNLADRRATFSRSGVGAAVQTALATVDKRV